ncbi:MAG: SNF2-related protein [Bacteroidales bacterium]|nr:SNF2-related protein [Bacteroidales bacterium]
MNLFPHQSEALKQTEGMNRVAFYHDMGLGKTFTGAEKMRQLGARVNLVICQKSKIADWISHFVNYYNDDFLISNLTGKCELEFFLIGKSNRIGIINYELAWRRPELLQLSDFTLMLDESSLIQNRKAKQTKFILKLQPKNVILLSGTPTSGKYENLWTQCRLLGWDISEALYNRQYINWDTIYVGGGMKRRVVKRSDPYKNVDRLKSKMREHGAMFLKTEECFELPDQTFIDVNVPVSKEYRKFMKDSIVVVDDDELVGDTTLTKRLYSRQLCGQYSQAKFDAFRDLVQSTNDRLIVFYNFNAELEKLVGECAELNRPVSIVSGQYKNLEAYEDQVDSVTFIQYQAGAMGLNLQKANKIVYFSLPERSELFEQSKKRIHRIGQEKPCFYYVMRCRGSVEDLIYETLKMRKDFTDELFRQNYFIDSRRSIDAVDSVRNIKKQTETKN